MFRKMCLLNCCILLTTFVGGVSNAMYYIKPPIVYPHLVSSNFKKEIFCLALNMYHEARDQGTAGLIAVSAVVLNRVNDKRFPNTICEVIKQGPIRASWKGNGTFFPIKSKCQFSWWCDGKSDKPKNKKTFDYMIAAAKQILTRQIDVIDITDGATFYHADHITPSWAKSKQRTIEIEDHIFYRWKIK